jgi:hypothetical protein
MSIKLYGTSPPARYTDASLSDSASLHMNMLSFLTRVSNVGSASAYSMTKSKQAPILEDSPLAISGVIWFELLSSILSLSFAER